jgi:hypothetical protein
MVLGITLILDESVKSPQFLWRLASTFVDMSVYFQILCVRKLTHMPCSVQYLLDNLGKNGAGRAGYVLRPLKQRPRAPVGCRKLGVSDASPGNPARADDEPLGRGANKIERVTGHQSESVGAVTLQHFSLLGHDHRGRVHAIVIGSA